MSLKDDHARLIMVSICMITYNHEKYIAQAIEGVLRQKTKFKYEIVISDDRSTDKTREICEQYKNHYPDKIKLLPATYKLGAIPNFARTLLACQGDYIAICEGDDYWIDPQKLQKQVDFLESNSAYVMTGHDAFIIDEAGEIIEKSKLPDQHKRDASDEELIKQSIWVLTCTACFRNVIHDFPEEFYKVLNGDTFFFSMIGQFGSFKYMGDEIKPAAYRCHAGGIWSLIPEMTKMLHSINTYKNLSMYYSKKDGFKECAQDYKNKVKIHEKWIIKSILNSNNKISNMAALTKMTAQKKDFGPMVALGFWWLFIFLPIKENYSAFRMRFGRFRRKIMGSWAA